MSTLRRSGRSPQDEVLTSLFRIQTLSPCRLRFVASLATFEWRGFAPSAGSFQRAFLAASAPFLPSAVRVFSGKCEIVFLDFAAAAALLMFCLAALRCFSVLICSLRFRAVSGFLCVRPLFLGGSGLGSHRHDRITMADRTCRIVIFLPMMAIGGFQKRGVRE